MSLADNLISFWELGESSGTRVDAHGSHDLTDNNTVGQGVGKVGNCADFEASGTEYLSHGDTAELSTGNIDFTVAAWIKLESSGGSPRIAAKGNWSNQREWTWYYTGLRFRFGIAADGVNLNHYVDSNNFGAASVGTWYFVIAWHDAAADTINIQINDGGVDSLATGGASPADRSGVFCIGTENGFGIFDGLIDQVGFWKRTLSLEERSQLYNNGSGLAYEMFENPTLAAAGLKITVLKPTIGLYDTRIKLRARARDTFLTTRVRNQ